MGNLSLVGLGLKILGLLAAPLRALLRWLGEDFRHILIFGLALLAAGAAWTARGNAGERDAALAQRDRWQVAATAERTARLKLIEAVQLARLAAAEADAANAERVERAMAANTERTADVYEAALADRDAALGRLRHTIALSARTGDSYGGGGAAGVPGDLTARCQAFGAPDCDALLAALPDLFAEAEGNTAKLIALQDWVRGVLLIDLSGERIVRDEAARPAPVR